MKLYYLKSCDTCRAARTALAARNPELIEIRANPIDRDTIDGWIAAVGADLLINRKSRTWRDLTDAARGLPAAELLSSHPTVMKRPVIVDGPTVHVGWTAAVKTALNVPD